MKEVGVLEAKTTFSALLAEVERTGEPIVITRHGKRVARLEPEAEPPFRSRPPRRQWTPEAWRSFLDDHWARLDAEAKANPALLDPYDLRADRDAIE